MIQEVWLASRRSRVTWWAVAGAVVTTVPFQRTTIGRWTWPQMMRSICGCSRHEGAEGGAVVAVDGVHLRQAGEEGRVVHGDDGGAVGVLRQPVAQPVEAGLAEAAAGFAGDEGIEGEQAERQVVERVVQELAVARQVGVVGEGLAQGGALVVVAGHQRPGDLQGRQHLPQVGVFGGAARSTRSPVIQTKSGRGSRAFRWATARTRKAGVSMRS